MTIFIHYHISYSIKPSRVKSNKAKYTFLSIFYKNSDKLFTHWILERAINFSQENVLRLKGKNYSSYQFASEERRIDRLK